MSPRFAEMDFGFEYGGARVERLMSDERRGWVVIGLKTNKHDLQVYVTKTGKVRITDSKRQEWKA